MYSSKMIGILTLTTGLGVAIVLNGCGESAEVRDIAKAQKCLDAVPQSSPASADNCFSLVQKHNSQQANILKCSIFLTGGGLTTAKITQAYKAAEDGNLNASSSVYVSFLALDNPTTTGYDRSLQAYNYCKSSEVSGLLFIAGLAKTGTLLAKLNGGVFDINDPTATQAAVDQILQDCASGTGGQDATTCDLTEIGNTIADIADVYCDNASSDKDVCDKVNAAIASAGGDNAEAAKKFLCELKDGTYTGGVCT